MPKNARLFTHSTLARRDVLFPNKAAASEEARRTLRSVASLNDARTPPKDFFSILSGGATDVSVPGDYYRKPRGGVKVNSYTPHCV